MFTDVLKALLAAEDEQAAAAVEPLTPAEHGERALFVDGGQACVYDAGAARVELLRVAGVAYRGRERVATKREEGLLVVQRRGERIAATSEGLGLSLSIPAEDEELRRGKEAVSLAAVAGLARYVLECERAAAWSDELGATAVVRDGTLDAMNRHEEEALARITAPVVGGLAKTHDEAPPDAPGAWTCAAGARTLVKLHPHGTHVFRLDGPATLAPLLAALSDDPGFLGYPYPLLEADRLARVSEQEKALLQLRLKAEAGADWRRLERLARAKDAHAVLDRQ